MILNSQKLDTMVFKYPCISTNVCYSKTQTLNPKKIKLIQKQFLHSASVKVRTLVAVLGTTVDTLLFARFTCTISALS